jgi:hypothetical protein
MVLVAMAGLEPAMTRLKDGRLSRPVHIAVNFGGAYENRTRLSPVDSRVPRQSVYAPENVGRPVRGRTGISAFGGLRPVPWTTSRKMVRAGGFEPPSLPVRSRVS